MGSRAVPLPDCVRFGDGFELDRRAYQLRSGGIPVKLKPTHMELLLLLVERGGELVTRHQIVERIWGQGVFLDTDNSINAAISRIRQVLRDDAAQPRFVETVTGRGYRFVAAVEIPPKGDLTQSDAGLAHIEERSKELHGVRAPIPLHRSRRRIVYVAVPALLVLAASLSTWWLRSKREHPISPGRAMIAVLPFKNLTGDSGQDYLSEGMTEEMITQLGRQDSQRVGVIGRTSVMRYKDNPKTLEQIGQELGVQYVLEGSVRRDAERIRITAQLIQVKDQGHLWAEEYDRDFSDLLVLQGEIARKISDQIEIALGGHRPSAPRTGIVASPANQEAYELYLKGQYFWNKRTPEGLERAIGYFQQATSKDPNYARAYAGLADSYALLGGYTLISQNEFMPKARAAALRAVELDDKLPEAHTAWALVVQNYDWDWQTAEKEFRRAIELNPSYATAHHWYAEHLAWMGRFDEALAESEKARQLEPLSLIIAVDHAVILYYARQYDRALAQFDAVRDMDPGFPRSGMLLRVYVQKGMMTEANAFLEWSHQTSGDVFWRWPEEAYVYECMGRHAPAKQALAKMEAWSRQHPFDASVFVPAYIGMGDKDRALYWLERAYAQHSGAMVGLKVDPVYDTLRSDPRFQDLLRHVGLAQ